MQQKPSDAYLKGYETGSNHRLDVYGDLARLVNKAFHVGKSEQWVKDFIQGFMDVKKAQGEQH